MKKRSLNKIFAFTLCCLMVSATVVNAKQVKETRSYKYSVYYSSVSLPDDPEESRH